MARLTRPRPPRALTVWLRPFSFCLRPFSFSRLPSAFLFFLPFAFVLFRSAAAAQPPPPLLTAPANDFANVVDAASKSEMERRIRALEQTTGDVVVVATVDTVQPYADVNEYAVKMFENAGRGIGQKGKDNGLLILVAVKDRRVRIETGYDLEAYITDGFAGDVIRNTMTPEFRQGRYGPGLLAATTRIINRIADGRGVTIPDVPRPRTVTSGNRPRIPLSLIIFVIFIIVVLSSRRRRGRRHWGGGPWSGWNSGVGPFGGGGFGGGFGGFGGGGGGGWGGGGGGGFGGFGGGRSGGGGASGGW